MYLGRLSIAYKRNPWPLFIALFKYNDIQKKGLPINKVGMLSAMADNMGGKNHMTKLSASYLPLPYLATFYPTIVCLSSHGLIAY